MEKPSENSFDNKVEQEIISYEDNRVLTHYENVLASHQQKKKGKKLAFLGLGLLLSVLALLGIYKFSSGDSDDQPVVQMAANMEIYSDPNSLFRGEEGQGQAINQKIDKALAKENYTEAIALFESQVELQSNSQRYPLAQLYFKTGQTEKALAQIALIEGDVEGGLQQEANWLKALVLMSEGKNEAARNILQGIISSKHYKWKEAQKILK